MEKKIKLFKLSSGEEIIAEISAESPDTVSVTKAVAIIMQPPAAANQGPRIGLAPWPMFISDGLKDTTQITQNQIMYRYTPMKEMLDQYKNAVSPILQPGGSLIVP